MEFKGRGGYKKNTVSQQCNYYFCQIFFFLSRSKLIGLKIKTVLLIIGSILLKCFRLINIRFRIRSKLQTVKNTGAASKIEFWVYKLYLEINIILLAN